MYIVKAEYDDEMKYISEFENKIQSSQSEKESTEDKIKNYKSDVETYSQEIVALQEKIRVQKEEYSDVRINYLNNVNKKEQLESEAQKLKFELTELEGSLDSNYARVEEVKVAIAKGHDTISELEKNVAEQMKIYENENQDVNSKKLAVTKLSEEERELINERKNLESTLIKINDQNSKQIDYIDKLRFDIEKISEQLTALIEIELKVIKEEEYETSRNRFKSLDNKLKNFETVNLLAI